MAGKKGAAQACPALALALNLASNATGWNDRALCSQTGAPVDRWRVLASVAAGAIFNVANALMCYGINLAGLSVGASSAGFAGPQCSPGADSELARAGQPSSSFLSTVSFAVLVLLFFFVLLLLTCAAERRLKQRAHMCSSLPAGHRHITCARHCVDLPRRPRRPAVQAGASRTHRPHTAPLPPPLPLPMPPPCLPHASPICPVANRLQQTHGKPVCGVVQLFAGVACGFIAVVAIAVSSLEPSHLLSHHSPLISTRLSSPRPPAVGRSPTSCGRAVGKRHRLLPRTTPRCLSAALPLHSPLPLHCLCLSFSLSFHCL